MATSAVLDEVFGGVAIGADTGRGAECTADQSDIAELALGDGGRTVKDFGVRISALGAV